MSKFRVGDWVITKPELDPMAKYPSNDGSDDDVGFEDCMYLDRPKRIIRIDKKGNYIVSSEAYPYAYTDEMLDAAEPPILGRTYTVKCDGDSCEINYDEDVADLPDSGTRREFSTGAVRDMAEGKGRCDLLPLTEVGELLKLDNLNCGRVIGLLGTFLENPVKDNVSHLYRALLLLCGPEHPFLFRSVPAMLLEVAKHFEAGAKKYGDNNWRKGIPARCYVDSAIRHYLKYLDGWTDEPHDRAVAWNILCCIWEVTNHDQSIYNT